MILPIVIYGNPVLRQKGKRIEKITPEIKKLAEDMIETMKENHGVGLAAQQIGQALQFAVVDVSGVEDRPSKMWIDDKEVDLAPYMPLIMVNPELTLTKSKESAPEGCLSFPELSCEIPRSKRVGVKTMLLDGSILEFDAAGLLGRAIQHEYDHLQGVLFIDRTSPAERAAIKDELEHFRSKAE